MADTRTKAELLIDLRSALEENDRLRRELERAVLLDEEETYVIHRAIEWERQCASPRATPQGELDAYESILAKLRSSSPDPEGENRG